MKKTLSLVLFLCLCAPAFGAEKPLQPSVKLQGGTVVITDGIDATGDTQLKEGKNLAKFRLINCADADLAKICNMFPGTTELTLEKGGLTSIAPVAKLAGLTRLTVKNVKVEDFAPVAGLTKLSAIEVDAPVASLGWMENLTALNSISIRSDKVTTLKGLPKLPNLKRIKLSHVAPDDLTPLVEAMPNLTNLDLSYARLTDLSPLAKLANMTDVNFYGATVKDFSPLAACPKLKSLMYYATKDADYATLGKLTQISELKGGLTKLNDISWIANMPNLKKFDVFAEYVTDYSPLEKTHLDRFQIWNMREPVDLTHVGKAASLKELKLWDTEKASNSKALSGLTNLEKMIVQGYNVKGGEAFDLGAASGWQNLVSLEIDKAKLVNLDALSACGKLAKVQLTKVEGVTSLDVLKKLPNLTSLVVTKGAFPDAMLQGFDPKVKISQR